MKIDNNLLVAISGRPNVGKSCLFNRLLGKRQSIVEASSGVTRDRVYAEVSWGKKEFQLVDTGGLHFQESSKISGQIIEQARKGIEQSALVLFVVDSTSGLTPHDMEILEFLRKSGKKLVMVVNKVDDMSKVSHLSEFYEAGVEPVIFVSALHGLNIDGLLDDIVGRLDIKNKTEKKDDPVLKIALIGKSNVGKSSFLNKLVNEQRSIVSDMPGTTRDSVDTLIKINGNNYLMIDTAGIKRKKKTKEAIDVFSRARTIQAVKRADVCVVLVDAELGIKRDDMYIFSLIKEEEKCCVIAINKSDLAKVTLEDCRHTLHDKVAYMNFAFNILCSAKKGKNLHAAIGLAHQAWDNSNRKIKQRFLAAALKGINDHLQNAGKRPQLKIHYLTQIKTNPPVFVMIVNRPELIKPTFLRFVESKIRSNFNFQGAPVKIIVRKKKKGTL